MAGPYLQTAFVRAGNSLHPLRTQPPAASRGPRAAPETTGTRKKSQPLHYFFCCFIPPVRCLCRSWPTAAGFGRSTRGHHKRSLVLEQVSPIKGPRFRGKAAGNIAASSKSPFHSGCALACTAKMRDRPGHCKGLIEPSRPVRDQNTSKGEHLAVNCSLSSFN